MILITAAEAHDLSNPTEAEEVARYLEEVDLVIRKAASAQVKEIILRIPMHLRDRMLDELSKAGFTYAAHQNIDRMSFFKVSWI